MFPPVDVEVTGERFNVVYRLTGNELEAREKAEIICLEQTAELSYDLLPPGAMREQVIGQIESLQGVETGAYEAVISYAVENSGFELIQFLNVVFGNSSMKRGIRVEHVEIPVSLLKAFPGPRFGNEGIRHTVAAQSRPLLGTALKPVGYPPEKLSRYAYQFASGGLDIIKDDHGLVDQPYARFEERARLCAEAVRKANEETGGCSIYIPNVSGPVDQVVEKAVFAKQHGAGGIEVCPGLVGFDAIRLLSSDERVNLPIFSHPAMLGTYPINRNEGLSYQFLYGQLMRLAGADGVIFAGPGGRFPATNDDCRDLIKGASRPMGHLKSILPMPGGGMTLERIPEMVKLYGQDVILLISGELFNMGPDLIKNCRRFSESVSRVYAEVNQG
ncbi:MAG: ribulose 1,5-bisphosphate carboxylase large subunit [Chloroflexota bacterium]|nr:MAG: ribulose 1,5-bisphosphate carboxylase large subunit [Chloroflexota bacterium]